MKSNFESADHKAIQRVKAPLALEARMLLNWNLSGRISSNMEQLARSNNVSNGLIIRLLTGELTGSERKAIREMAGLTGPKEEVIPPEAFFFPKKK